MTTTARPLLEVLTEHVAQINAQRIPIGSRVEFREDTPQHPANKGIVYLVTSAPHIDRTHGDTRLYVWLEVAADADKAPSRRRTRSAYVTALRIVEG